MTDAKPFSERLAATCGGRFAAILNTLDVKDACEQCYYFNPEQDDPRMGYRCHVLGSCPDATLSVEVQAAMWDDLLGNALVSD